MKAKRRSKDLFISVFDIFGQHLQTKKPWNSHELQGKRTRFSSVIQDKKNVIQEQIYLPCQNTPKCFYGLQKYKLYLILYRTNSFQLYQVTHRCQFHFQLTSTSRSVGIVKVNQRRIPQRIRQPPSTIGFRVNYVEISVFQIHDSR